MPDLNDFYAFKMTSSNNGGGNKSGGNGSGGNGSSGNANLLVWIVAIICILWIVGKLF